MFRGFYLPSLHSVSLCAFKRKSFNFSFAVGEIWEAFAQLSEEDFESKYGFEKPSKGEKIGLSCLSGKRATDASDKLLLLQYENNVIYKGSLKDWKAQGGPVESA